MPLVSVEEPTVNTCMCTFNVSAKKKQDKWEMGVSRAARNIISCVVVWYSVSDFHTRRFTPRERDDVCPSASNGSTFVWLLARLSREISAGDTSIGAWKERKKREKEESRREMRAMRIRRRLKSMRSPAHARHKAALKDHDGSVNCKALHSRYLSRKCICSHYKHRSVGRNPYPHTQACSELAACVGEKRLNQFRCSFVRSKHSCGMDGRTGA